LGQPWHAPPDSAFPSLAAGTLVDPDHGGLRFPAIPRVAAPVGLANPVLVYDFGPRFDYVNQTGLITRQPPAILRVVPALAAQVDADGNETSGVPSVQMMAPLGSYLSWNRYREGPMPGNSAPSTPVSCPLRAPRRSAWLQATAGLRSRNVIIRGRVTFRPCRRRPRPWPSAFCCRAMQTC
jgi:hypothetical protein